MWIARFLNNWSINFGHKEIRIWRYWPYKIEYINWKRCK